MEAVIFALSGSGAQGQLKAVKDEGDPAADAPTQSLRVAGKRRRTASEVRLRDLCN